MHFFEASSSIQASPAEVWAQLIDVTAWPSWSSGVESVEGAATLGQKLVIRSQAAPDRAFPV